MTEGSEKAGYDELNVIDMIVKLYQHKSFIVIFVFFVCFITAIYSLMLPKTYKSTAKILPVSNSNSNMMINSGLASVASMMGFSGLGGQTPSQQFLTILDSRTMAEKVMKKCDLMKLLFKSEDAGDDGTSSQIQYELAVRDFRGMVSFSEDIQDSSIAITAELEDAKLAKKIIETYLDELKNFINNNTLTMAKRNRVYLGEQLRQNKKDLLLVGKAISGFYNGGNVSNINANIDVYITDSSSLRTSALLTDDLKTLYAKKKKIDYKLDGLDVLKDIPQQTYLQYLEIKKNLLIQVNSILTQQFEMAKIQEGKDGLVFQIVDDPTAPKLRAGPRRTFMVMVAFFISTILACMLVLLQDTFNEIYNRLKIKKN